MPEIAAVTLSLTATVIPVELPTTTQKVDRSWPALRDSSTRTDARRHREDLSYACLLRQRLRPNSTRVTLTVQSGHAPAAARPVAPAQSAPPDSSGQCGRWSRCGSQLLGDVSNGAGRRSLGRAGRRWRRCRWMTAPPRPSGSSRCGPV